MATLCLSNLGVCQEGPLAALALLLSAVAAPVFQATTLFRQWLITALMKCEGSGNVTRMTWACQCGPAGRSVSHTDIWKDREHQPLAAFSRKELLITWAGFCWILCNFIFFFFTYSIISLHWQRVLPEPGFQADVFVISLLIKWNVNPIKGKTIYHTMSENVLSLLIQQSILAHSEWAVNTWWY